VFATLSFTAHSSRRFTVSITPALSDCVVIRVIRRGAVLGFLNGSPIPLQAGHIHIHDGSCDVIDFSGHLTQTSVYIPYANLGMSESKGLTHLKYPAGAPVGRLIDGALTSAISQMPSADSSDCSRVVEGFTGMMRALMRGIESCPEASDCAEAQRTRAMQDYLLDNLQYPDLGVATLCKTFAVSRATVYRLFAALGGVASYVKKIRLERAYQDLASGPAERGRILATALRYGFTDASSFSRAFRNEFGTSPTAVVGTSVAESVQTATSQGTPTKANSSYLLGQIRHAAVGFSDG